MQNRREAILAGIATASRLHRSLDLRRLVEHDCARIDVFGSIIRSKIPLVFRPLEGLLGAYLPSPKGIIITTQRPLSVQRFTGAHELGHAALGHEGSLDDDSLLSRSPFASPSYDQVEAAADAFATNFLLPIWMIEIQASRHKWTRADLLNPVVVYQLSLRVGASYRATCMALRRHELIDQGSTNHLLSVEVKTIKRQLLDGHELDNWHPDVWLLTEADAETSIEGDARDAFVLRLKENSSAGYLWNIDQLEQAGFLIFHDGRVLPEVGADVGGPVERVLGAQSQQGQRGHVDLHQVRPWQSASPLTTFSLAFDLRGKETGRPRAERRQLAAA